MDIILVKVIKRCPICNNSKDIGLIVCRECAGHEHDEKIQKYESTLREVDTGLCGVLSAMSEKIR